MPVNELSHKERVLLSLNHRQTDRIPIAMVCSGINMPAYNDLSAWLAKNRQISVESYLAHLIDIISLAPVYIGPSLSEGTDIWSVKRKPVSYGLGYYEEIDYYPLADIKTIGDLQNFTWPSIEWFDYKSMKDMITRANESDEYCLMVSGGNIFETAWYMRGLERMFEDTVINPDFAYALMNRITDFYIEHTKRMLEESDGKIDLVFTADDIGGQQGLLISLNMWETLIKPHHVRLNKVIHEYGAKVIYHSDGSIMKALPGLVDMGIDILQALQFDADDMNPRTMKKNFGDVLCFEGGISVQRTLPFGTVEDVIDEVNQRIEVLGENGGYILGPSHAIQAGTPPENIAAMFDTASGLIQRS